MQKEICWILSNVLANGWKSVIMSVLRNEYLMKQLIDAVCSNNTIVTKEAMHVFANILAIGDSEALDIAICSWDLLAVFTHLLQNDRQDVNVTKLVMKSIDLVL